MPQKEKTNMEYLIEEKNNNIQRTRLYKVVGENGKITYRIMHRDKIHMEEENTHYKRVDFAIEKFKWFAGIGYSKLELTEKCRNTPAKSSNFV